MDLEKIKAMYTYSKEIENKYSDFLKETKEEQIATTNKAIEKINKFFNDLLDVIDEDRITFKFNGSSEYAELVNKEGKRYAVFPYKYAKVLVSTNNTGEIKNGYETKTIERHFYNHLRVGSQYHEKANFVNYFLKNQKDIEETIMKEISDRLKKRDLLNAEKIQNQTAYLERIMKYTEEN